jgi:transposase
LDYLLLQGIARFQNTIGSPVFQHNNALIHKAQIVQAFFGQNHITVEGWLATSLDLNLIEYVWVEPKRRVHIKYSNIKDTREGPNKMRERLAEVPPKI